MARPVTQRDIARMVGVSRPTVSRVLSGRLEGGIQVSVETKQRIEMVARELGYAPRASALGLRYGRTNTIGLLLPDAFNPFYLVILRGVEAAARERGYHLIVVVSDLQVEIERACLRTLAQRRVDGLIVVLAFPERVTAELAALRRTASPMLALTPGTASVDSVLGNYEQGAVQMMEHLFALGHQRIGFIHGVAEPSLGTDRLNIYRRKLTERGIAVDEGLIIHCGPTVDDGHAAAHRLLALPQRPTAILGVNDLMAVGAMQAAGECGLAVPGQVSIAGFDDIDLAAHLSPPLTTARLHAEEKGRQAVQLLLERLDNPDLPLRHVDLKCELMVRQSTGPCPPPVPAGSDTITSLPLASASLVRKTHA